MLDRLSAASLSITVGRGLSGNQFPAYQAAAPSSRSAEQALCVCEGGEGGRWQEGELHLPFINSEVRWRVL